MDYTPRQSAPVTRPEIIAPHTTIDVVHGRIEDLVRIRMNLTHGANFNDPPAWRFPSYDALKTSSWR